MSRKLAFGKGKRAVATRSVLAGAILLATTAVSQASYGFATYTAVVLATGILAQSNGVQAAQLTGTGLYNLTFSRDIISCTSVASIASGFPGFISSNVNAAKPAVLVVRTFSVSGAPKNSRFDVVISCGP